MARSKDDKPKTRRPPNTAFHQQRLQAWQPVLDIFWVCVIFLIIPIITLPVGGWFLYESRLPQTIDVDYSNCSAQAPTHYAPIPNGRVRSTFNSARDTIQPVQWKKETGYTATYPGNVTVDNTTRCFLQFPIPNDVHAPVYLFYKMTRFYQNHRRYLKSFDSEQLKGQARTASQISNSDCDPLKDDANGKPYYPCGLIANSIFNDTFNSPTLLNPQGGSGNVTYNMTNKGIAWSSDGKLYGKTLYNSSQVVPPPNWRRKYPDYSKGVPDLSTDEAFWVWMRPAAFSTFSKLALRNDHDTLAKGQYEVIVWDEFDTTVYNGEKHMVLTTVSAIGLFDNNAIAIIYLTVGSLCLLLGIGFVVAWKIRSRPVGDHEGIPEQDRSQESGRVGPVSGAQPPSSSSFSFNSQKASHRR